MKSRILKTVLFAIILTTPACVHFSLGPNGELELKAKLPQNEN